MMPDAPTPPHDPAGDPAVPLDAALDVSVDVARQFLIERYSERIYELYPDILAVVDAQGRLARVNPAFTRITGRQAADAAGQPLADWLHPDERRLFADLVAQLHDDYDRFNVVARLARHTAGGGTTWCWISWSCFAGMEAGSLFCVGRDVTPQKEAEISLLQRERQLVQTIDLAGLPTWELDLGTLDFVFNDHMLALLGTTAAAEQGYRMDFNRFMARHSDRANVSNIVQRIVRVARSRSGDYTDVFEYHLRTPGGERFTAEFHLRGLLDDNQYMLRAFGTVQLRTEPAAAAAPAEAPAPPADPPPAPAPDPLGEWQALVQAAPAPLLLLDGAGAVLAASPAAEAYRAQLDVPALLQADTATVPLAAAPGQAPALAQVTRTQVAGRALVLVGVVPGALPEPEPTATPEPAPAAPETLAWRALMASLDEAVITADDTGVVLDVNRGTEQMFGHSRSSLVGQHLGMLIPEHYRGLHDSGMERLRGGAPPHLVGRTVQVHALHASGQIFPVRLTLTQWADPSASGATRFTALLRDISQEEDWQATLERLRLDVEQQTATLRQLFHHQPDALIVTDGARILQANPAAEALGLHPDASLFAALRWPEGLDASAALAAAAEGELPVALRAGADELPYHLAARPLAPQADDVAPQWLLRLLPAPPAAAPESLNARVEALLQAARVATWQLHADGRLHLSSRFLAWMGTGLERPDGEWHPLEDFLRDYVHPEDGPRVRQALLQTPAAEPQVAEFRLLGTAGRTRYLTLYVQAPPPEAGLGERFGIAQDVTEVRLIEQDHQARTRRAERQLTALTQFSGTRRINGLDLPALMRDMAHEVCEVLDIDRCGIWTLREDHVVQLEVLYDRSNDTYTADDRIDFKEKPVYYGALQTERILPVKYVTIDPRTAEHVESYLLPAGISSLMDVAIKRDDEVVGVMCCEHRGFPRDWHLNEQRFILEMADLLATAMQNAAHRTTDALLAERATELAAAHEARVALAQQLEALQAERATTNDQLKQAHQFMVANEKLVSLGQLVAGVAHEVNTPISAVLSSARSIDRSLENVLAEVPTLLRNLGDSDARLFLELVQRSTQVTPELSPAEERDYRTQVKAVLDEHQVPGSFELAKELVEIRVLDDVGRYAPLFRQALGSEIVDKVYKLVQLKKGLMNIEAAAEKTARVVRALKTYSHSQPSEERVPMQLADSLETVLTVYHNQLKYGISVDTYFAPDAPPVPVYPDEISQVWTNLISNAVYAMKGKGRLNIEHWVEGDSALVRVTDNGPGIAENILPHIFEPFFTTKPAGEGAGLGLDITKKIVEKHGGDISVRTTPGQTSFTVRLPLQATEAPPEAPAAPPAASADGVSS